jgi:demethylmenaquinone methyltransferase/2-methoxy-6-polyprenyl-1,4-benzoquinol methylase
MTDRSESQTAEDMFEAGVDRASYVRGMFGDISARYDLMNTLMTGGRHHAWRREAARALVRPGAHVLDVGCGTGDLSFACMEAGAASVVGLDFARPMLVRARSKTSKPGARWVGFGVGDATRLPVADDSVDVWCSAFVVRNIPDLDTALREALRVLKPGGRLGILEIPRMERGLRRPAARVHFQHVIPRMGRLISGHGSAYSYLPVSVDHFLTPDEVSSKLRMAGFEVRGVRTFMFGTVALHVAEKPAA